MDALTALIASGGLIALILSVIVAIVVLVMPFLVWFTNSRVKEMDGILTSVEAALTELQIELDAMDLKLDVLTGGRLPADVQATLTEMNRLRLEAVKQQVRLLELRGGGHRDKTSGGD